MPIWASGDDEPNWESCHSRCAETDLATQRLFRPTEPRQQTGSPGDGAGVQPEECRRVLSPRWKKNYEEKRSEESTIRNSNTIRNKSKNDNSSLNKWKEDTEGVFNQYQCIIAFYILFYLHFFRIFFSISGFWDSFYVECRYMTLHPDKFLVCTITAAQLACETTSIAGTLRGRVRCTDALVYKSCCQFSCAYQRRRGVNTSRQGGDRKHGQEAVGREV